MSKFIIHHSFLLFQVHEQLILTFVNNSYSIVKEHIRRVSFRLYPSHLKRLRGFVSVVAAVTCSFRVQSYNI